MHLCELRQRSFGRDQEIARRGNRLADLWPDEAHDVRSEPQQHPMHVFELAIVEDQDRRLNRHHSSIDHARQRLEKALERRPEAITG